MALEAEPLTFAEIFDLNQVARLARKMALSLVLLALSIQSAAAIPMLLVDAKTLQVLYAEDAGQPWHPASLTKMMTAYLAFAAIADGRWTPSPDERSRIAAAFGVRPGGEGGGADGDTAGGAEAAPRHRRAGGRGAAFARGVRGAFRQAGGYGADMEEAREEGRQEVKGRRREGGPSCRSS